jgi:hypothetical protein
MSTWKQLRAVLLLPFAITVVIPLILLSLSRTAGD